MTNKEKSELQKQVVDATEPGQSGRWLLAPRSGKSKTVIDLIKRDKPESILWVTPSAKLADEDIPFEFNTWKAKRFLKKLTTVTWMSLSKIEGHFDMIILDEEQYMTENNYKGLFNKTLTYNVLISMTGTPTKHEDKIQLYKNLKLKTIFELTISNAVSIGLLSNYVIKVVNVNLGKEKNIEAGNKTKRFMTTEESQYNYLSKMVDESFGKNKTFRILNRMRAIKNSLSKLNATKSLLSKLEGRILIFSGTIKQAEELSNHTYHSKTDNKDLKLFQNGDIDKIAMVNAGGTGFTYREIDHLLIVQADSDKNGLTSQKIARTLLKQKNYGATVWIICLNNTQDAKWVNSALANFDKNKIEYVSN